jgi:hypothetical protein
MPGHDQDPLGEGESRADETPEPEPQDDAEAPRTLWRRVHKSLFSSAARATVTGIVGSGIVGLIIAIALSGSGSTVSTRRSVYEPTLPVSTQSQSPPAPEPPAAPSVIDTAHELRAYVLSRSFWKIQPTVFGASLRLAVNPPVDSDYNLLLPSDGGVVDAYSVSDLISQGATMDAESFLAVGRVEKATASPVSFDQGVGGMLQPTDAELTNAHGGSVIYALFDGGTVSNGDVVYFPAVVAAVGVTNNGNTTAYVVGLDSPALTSTYGPSLGESVPQVARSFGKAALPSRKASPASGCFLFC